MKIELKRILTILLKILSEIVARIGRFLGELEKEENGSVLSNLLKDFRYGLNDGFNQNSHA